jgi:hypothetical protein
MTLAAMSLALAFALGLAIVPATARCADAEWHLIGFAEHDTPFDKDELPLRPATGGLALTVVDGLWNLVPAKLSTRVADPAGHPDVVLLVATPPDALAYLRLPALAAGKVDTPDMRFKDVLRDIGRTTVAVPFKATPYRFELKAGASWLTNGTLRQEIAAADPKVTGPEADMRSVNLLWAGDLDHDGKLDFIISDWFDDGGTMCVWLSSRAAPGQLAASVACFNHAV